jgi:hypothetical protein
MPFSPSRNRENPALEPGDRIVGCVLARNVAASAPPKRKGETRPGTKTLSLSPASG